MDHREQPIDDQDLYKQAQKRVEAVKGFYSHLAVYLLVNTLLLLLDLITSPGHYWFYWPLLGWGIGLLAHFLSVFVMEGFLGAEWEQRRIQRYMDKHKNR